MIANHANTEWQRLLAHVIGHGEQVVARQKSTVELVGVRSQVDMRYPAVTVMPRMLKGYLRFLPAEAHWILSGSNQVRDIAKYAPQMRNFSDNGYTLQGAYGPWVTEQLQYVCETLRDDLNSRQAVIEIWRPAPRYSKDIPCTLSLQFLIRSSMLHCIATMRSSDLWLGWPFDVFSFSMITAWICLRLRTQYKISTPQSLQLQPGVLSLTAGSQHIYTHDLQRAQVAALSTEVRDYSAMSIHEFNTPDDLMIHLRDIRDARWSKTKSGFLREFKEWR